MNQHALQQSMTVFWDSSGATYDEHPRHGLLHEREKEAWLAALRDLLPSAPADVLDVGTGTGFLALLCAELGHRVTGIDLSEGMLAAARRKVDARAMPPAFMLGDAIDPPLPEASFDVVINRHLLWTLLNPERALANWYRLLRRGGRLLAIDALWWLERRSEQPDDGTQQEAQYTSRQAYNAEVDAALPVMQMRSIEPLLEMVRAAGFADVDAVQLEEITAAERELHPRDDREIEPRYVLRGTRPAG